MKILFHISLFLARCLTIPVCFLFAPFVTLVVAVDSKDDFGRFKWMLKNYFDFMFLK